ncbi:arylamine N-acetyltransferase [Pseudoalteromonas sp. MMG005]|uniref:arylamine N-acetyltransferase family protein n=1 Tax=Pseudoalteromonas sp. MMG005 TaxID=2822682 RepID=UPI001B3A185A|nr:arylamine N-acetyltransferase [Pseudoalteromonas sp. MMG005]MBQ4844815.1 arylamine N-acetyltransferase [Pseudoalteromonas sp. MMG005]
MEKCDALYIQQYLAQLDLAGDLTGLALVGALQARHLAEFSFSSINAMSDTLLPLDEELLFDRLISQHQGGYCFEHNKVAGVALSALGFEVRPVLARVMLNGAKTNPRTHRLTLLTFEDNEYLVDVGFGVNTPIIPLLINRNNVIRQENNEYEIKRTENAVTVKMLAPEPISLYEADLSIVYEGDCDVAHFYSHQHPNAGFVNNLVVSRIEQGERYLIRNNSYIYCNENTDEHSEQIIDNAGQLHTLFTEQFKLKINAKKTEQVFKKMRNMVAKGLK